MPMIIDANRSADFCVPVSGRGKEILKGIQERKVKIVAGGQLLRELANTKIRDLLTEWSRTGCLKHVQAASIEAEVEGIAVLPIVSNDSHVVALARITHTRLIYTDDQALMKDFKNLLIINPKGKVIKSTTSKNISLSLIRNYAA